MHKYEKTKTNKHSDIRVKGQNKGVGGVRGGGVRGGGKRELSGRSAIYHILLHNFIELVLYTRLKNTQTKYKYEYTVT